MGTTHTAAAVCRLGDSTREAEIAVVAPSLLQLTDAGSFAVGDVDPGGWTAWGFSRRVGDAVPLVLGPETCSAEELTALMIMWIAGQVMAREGVPAQHVAVAHPVGWGPYRRGLLHQALRQVGIDNATLLPEPVAAAENHAARDRVPVGSTLAVYSMGSHAFSCSLVRRTPGRTFEVLSGVDTVDHHAGTDFDDALGTLIRGKLGKGANEVSALECGKAKTVLSHAPHVDIRGVTITRAEFAEEIRPAVEHSVQTLVRTVGDTKLDAVLLVGGAVRVPAIPDALAAALDCRILAEAAPETSVVKGAALAARLLVEGPEEEPEPPTTSVMARSDDLSLRFPVGEIVTHDQEITAPPPRPPVDITPLDLPERSSVKRVVRGLKPAGARRSTHDDDDDEDSR
ncbi:Hsp70 family protein [Lentzea tibetensis]|uniref:Hsp70 family protein n=1 Tax=Lentzea tibetensis TaxID=2591470 RepID=UPI001F38A636|nr:Hsp70 family protein [Lentzea tibetensis]